jgi:hypothetical protein
MNIIKWFTPKDKRNVVIPQTNVGPMQGADLIRAFSTVDEPKVKDFPKESYKVYWEIFIEAIPGGYGALVRFYEFSTGQVHREKIFQAQSVLELRAQVSQFILSTMEQNKR